MSTARDVYLKYGVRPSRSSSLSRREKREAAAMAGVLPEDGTIEKLSRSFFDHMEFLHGRGFISGDAPDFERDGSKFVKDLCMREMRSLWNDMACDPDYIMSGTGDGCGFWPYLDREYVDVEYLKVGKAILSVDECWSYVVDSLRDTLRECKYREDLILETGKARCSRCGKPVAAEDRHSYDMWLNALWCGECVDEMAE